MPQALQRPQEHAVRRHASPFPAALSYEPGDLLFRSIRSRLTDFLLLLSYWPEYGPIGTANSHPQNPKNRSLQFQSSLFFLFRPPAAPGSFFCCCFVLSLSASSLKRDLSSYERICCCKTPFPAPNHSGNVSRCLYDDRSRCLLLYEYYTDCRSGTLVLASTAVCSKHRYV